jgi:hypothetical protein
MKHIKVLLGCAIILTIVINSCKKTEQTSVPLTGTLKGVVTLYDEYKTLTVDKSGITVSIDSTVPLKTSVTDIDGNYQIDSLPSGRYNISFSKTGYADRKIIDYAFAGGILPQYCGTYLTKPSTTIVTNFAMTINSNSSVLLAGVFSPEIPDGEFRLFLLFLSNSSSVSSTNYMDAILLGSNTTILDFRFSIDKTIFPSGTSMYAKAYGDSYRGYQTLDSETGLMKYATLNPTGSNTVSIVVP